MDLSSLGSWITRDFGVQVAHLEPVGLGADARADLHHVVATDGREYAAKASTGPQPGLAVADLAASRGVLGAPAPLRTRDGDLTSSLPPWAASGSAGGAAPRLSLVPWVVGHRVLDTGMAPRAWVALGELLGALHSVPTDAAELGRVPVEQHEPSAVVRRTHRLAAVVAEAARTMPSDPVVTEVVGLWATQGPRLSAVTQTAERLATAQAWAGAPAVLCHGDPHHGNLVVDGGGQVWLVDWDDAVLAPREADLMFVVGGVFSHGPITDDQVHLFFEGYSAVTGMGPEALHPDLMTYLRAVRALVDVVDLLETAVSGEMDGDTRADALRYARATCGPGGLVGLVLD